MKRPPEDADPNVPCDACKHPPAYHDGDDGQKNTPRPCRAWDPDQPDYFCACPGWKEPKPPAPPLDGILIIN